MVRRDRPLRQLLEWRQGLEREALAAVAAAQGRLRDQQAQLESLRSWRTEYLGRETQRAGGRLVRASELSGARAFLANLDTALAQQERLLERLEQEVEGCRGRWRAAAAERRVAEKLLERRRHDARVRGIVLERRQLDDLVQRPSALTTADHEN